MFSRICAEMVRGVGEVGGEGCSFGLQQRARGVEGLGKYKDSRHSNIITKD